MKPSIPKGTRDFTPSEVNLRDFVKEKIKSNFELFGFGSGVLIDFVLISLDNSEQDRGEEPPNLIRFVWNACSFKQIVSFQR